MKLTKNFYQSEFIVSKFYDEGTQAMVWETFNYHKSYLLPNIQKLASQLQTVRSVIDKPINVNIAYRPLWWEYMQGRNGTSQHVLGKAADISCELDPKELYDIIESLINSGNMLQGGLGVYNNFVHYDTRKTKARWDYRD